MEEEAIPVSLKCRRHGGKFTAFAVTWNLTEKGEGITDGERYLQPILALADPGCVRAP